MGNIEKLELNTIIISGKILEQHTHNQYHYHRIVMPSLDEYTAPVQVIVRSSRTLGPNGGTVAVACKPIGFTRSFKKSDGTRGHDVKTYFEPITQEQYSQDF
jgi:hypothetical protein